jgi:hypothetical protein
LTTAFDIDNRETTVAQSDNAIKKYSARVRSSMTYGSEHALDFRVLYSGSSDEVKFAGYAAHGEFGM